MSFQIEATIRLLVAAATLAIAASPAVADPPPTTLLSVTYQPYGVAIPQGETLVTDFSTSTNLTLTPPAMLATGTTVNEAAAPAFSATTSDPNQYLAVLGSPVSSAVVTFAPTDEVSIYVGSLDSYNGLDIEPGGHTFTGSALDAISSAHVSDQQASVNGRFIFIFSSPVTSVKFTSAANSFEVADVAEAGAGIATSSNAGLISDGHGGYYGVTALGGAHGYGTLYDLAPPGAGQSAWTKTTLFSFDSTNGGPNPEIDIDGSGVLYVTGGVNKGVIVSLTPPAAGQTAWTAALLHQFTGGDGAAPYGGLVRDESGALYGATSSGGNGPCTDGTGHTVGCGVVYGLAPPAAGQTAWTLTLLHQFQGAQGGDGQTSYSSLLRDASGALYGTTAYGGSGPCAPFAGAAGCGVVFELTPPAAGQTAWGYAVLHSFVNDAYGAYPLTGLVMDGTGDIYGTSSRPIAHDVGVVYELSPPTTADAAWRIERRAQLEYYGSPPFQYGGTASAPPAPAGQLLIDAAGTLYGTVSNGPSRTTCYDYGCGQVYSLTPPPEGAVAGTDWTLDALYQFTGVGPSPSGPAGDGAAPSAGLLPGPGGSLLGVTLNGGTGACGSRPFLGCGTVFQVMPHFTPGTPWTESVLYRFLGGADGMER